MQEYENTIKLLQEEESSRKVLQDGVNEAASDTDIEIVNLKTAHEKGGPLCLL